VRFHVLGSSGTFPAAGRPGSGYLVARDDTRVWVDAGPGTFLRLADLTDPVELTAMVVTHVHADHCVDVFALHHLLAYGPRRRSRPLPLFLPPGAAAHLSAFATDGERFASVFDLREVGDGERATAGACTLAFAAAEHSVPALAVRVEAGTSSLFYSGDTGVGGTWSAAAAGVKLMLCEATLQGEREPGGYPFHLTAAEAAGAARAAGARRLMLTHLPPTLDPARSLEEAEAVFGRPVELAVPGLEVNV